MKIAILSDIHGNSDALKAVLAQADEMQAERFFVCGDLAGYYYDAGSVIDMLRDRQAVICRGNHEDLFQGWINGDAALKQDLRRKYGSAFEVAENTLNDDQMDFLLNLPHPVQTEEDGVRFLISHGAPWDLDTYLYPDAKEGDLQVFEDYAEEYDVILTGHTHYPCAWEIGSMTVLNPGSVGQPRSGQVDEQAAQARTHWALYDTKERSYAHYTAFYDPSDLFGKIDQFDPHLPYLKQVLLRQENAA